MKKTIIFFIFILIALGVIFSIRFFTGGEDSWICEKGEWVKHGNPKENLKPIGGCGEIPVASSTNSNLIKVSYPLPGNQISSPLIVKGEARGFWFFEASFPVTLTNWDGLIIAEGIATAEGEWMTEEFVPFTASLNFIKPSYGTNGFLILKKDNPSGLPENDASIEIPINFI